jgi:nickel-dependent lactate racemase
MHSLYLTKIKQHFRNNTLPDVKGEVQKELLKLKFLIKPGANIALAVGSRGIRNLAVVVKEVADFIKENQAFPFIIPAMGSHGGATAEGQEGVLESYGISEKTIGVQVRSSMEVVELPRGDSPYPVYLDKIAYESDGIILINRIKPHTDFHSKYESGLIKMAVIGLGKERQASAVHCYGVYGLSVLVPLIARQSFRGKILGDRPGRKCLRRDYAC